MSTNTEIVRRIQAEFANLQSEKKTLEGNHEMTLREAVRALYPTLQRMKKRGFTTREMAQKLNENGIVIKPATLAKYLKVGEFRLNPAYSFGISRHNVLFLSTCFMTSG